MQTFLEILKFTLPSAIMLIGIYFIINKIFKQESERRSYELMKLNKDVVLPVRLRAYERLTLVLERTKPQSMLMRYDFNGYSVVQLQQLLLQTVRDEFDHNVSQQIYVSREAWVMITNARESVVQLINTVAAASMAENKSAMDYANALIATYASAENAPTEIALDFLKREVKQF